jgi:hypothetical protein
VHSNIKSRKIKRVFAPGCALMLYKPELTEKLYKILSENLGGIEKFMICCHHDPQFQEPAEIINVCPGCDKRFRNDYQNSSTISFWEIIAERDFFPFPDHHGKSMTIIDACPTRDQERVHIAIRKVLQKLNITLVEPKHTRTNSTCCGDSFYGVIPTDKVKGLMIKRASEMPLDDVVVYCVSCVKSVFNGGRKPHYIIDLLFDEETVPGTCEPDEWHNELNEYIEAH